MTYRRVDKSGAEPLESSREARATTKSFRHSDVPQLLLQLLEAVVAHDSEFALLALYNEWKPLLEAAARKNDDGDTERQKPLAR